METPTLEDFRAALAYAPRTGVLTWRQRPAARVQVGDAAGTLNGNGYLQFQFRGKAYQAHRVAWLLQTGEWPALLMDHRNGVRTDNRWSNLRAANFSQNTHNSGARSTNKLGIKGVRFHARDRKFHARIFRDGRSVYLGGFDTADEAAEAFKAAAAVAHGEFAR